MEMPFMKILGIDPGTLQLGWGIIETDEVFRPKFVDHGCLVAPAKMDFMGRIGILGELVQKLISEQRPDVAVIEKIFLGKNVDSAFKLGHIRGICAVECQNGCRYQFQSVNGNLAAMSSTQLPNRYHPMRLGEVDGKCAALH